MSKNISITEIPIEFVLNNLTQYQKESIELRYEIFSRVMELKKKGIKMLDIYLMISEEKSLQPDTINKIYNATVKNLIIAVEKK